MTLWRIAGRCFADPPPGDWRSQLAARLGQRPRRVGEWVELALFGALKCMDAAGEATLLADALLSVASVHGPDVALRAALVEARDGLPLPIGFLKSQPGQVLPALAQHLAWQGNGRCLVSRDPLATLMLACAEAPVGGLLLGWVEEDGAGRSIWLRLVAAPGGATDLRPGSFAELADPALSHLAIQGMELHVGP